MKPVFFTVLFCLLVAQNSLADQIRVYGHVTNPDSEPVAQAEIRFQYGEKIINTTSDGAGYYEVYLPLPVSVDEKTKPLPLSLSQNYPNPFNPVTTIPYQIDIPQHVLLDIYSITGQHVRTLVNGYKPEGNYQANWDGVDSRGRHVAAGIYLYQLRVGGSRLTKKMVLLDGGAGFCQGYVSETVQKALSNQYQYWWIDVFFKDYAYYHYNLKIDTESREEVQHEVIMKNFDILHFRSEYDTGSCWNFSGADVASKTVFLDEEYTISVVDSVVIDTEQYWIMEQDWNPILPDTLYVREEEGRLYWYINNKKQLVFDTFADFDTIWTIRISDAGDTVNVENVIVSNVWRFDRIYKYTLNASGDCWYECYHEMDGLRLMHKKIQQQSTSALLFEHNYTAIDYEFFTLWDKLSTYPFLVEGE